MINILLSQFYDGCAVFRNKVSSFHPLVITILNLPPNYRFKIGNDFYCYWNYYCITICYIKVVLTILFLFLGVGMLALTIFSSKIKSIAEDFLFNNFYVEELLHLSRCPGSLAFLQKFGIFFFLFFLKKKLTPHIKFGFLKFTKSKIHFT